MRQEFKAYIRNTCNNTEYEEVKRFVADPKNNLELDGLLWETWKEVLAEHTPVEPHQELLDQIHHQIALQEKNPGRTIRLYKTLAQLAGILLVGLILTILFLKPSSNHGMTQEITTPKGSRTNFTLSDGTEIWLNGGSTLRYPIVFGDVRKVSIRGEAYFKVTHNSSPFVVESQYGEVEVKGTEFDVTAYPDEPFVTTVVTGSVQYTDNNSHQILLSTGQQVVNDSGTLKSQKVEAAVFTSWKEGRLIFRDEPFGKVVASLERWYNVDIRLDGDKLKNLKYNGTIEMESFSEVLELINVTTPINYAFDRQTRILTISSE